MSLLAIGLNHRTAPIALREKVGIRTRQPLRALHLRSSDPESLRLLGSKFATEQVHLLGQTFAAERYCVSFSRVYRDFETVVLRYFNVFGERQSPFSQYAAVVPLLRPAPGRDPPCAILKNPTEFEKSKSRAPG